MNKIRIDHFSRLWVSHFFSQIANYLLLFLLLGHTFEATGSSVALGMLWIVYALPTFFLGPFSGSVIDLWSKRKILIVTNFLHSLLTASYAATVLLHKNFFIYPLFFFYSIINQFNNPAESAAVPAVTQKDRLTTANNILFFTDQASLVLGSALSGVLARLLNPFIVILISAFFTFSAAVNSYFLPHDNPSVRHYDFSGLVNDLLEKIKEGYQFLAQKKLLLYSFVLMMVFQIITTIGALIMPQFSTEILHLTSYDASYLVVFPLACGVMAGTLYLNKNKHVRKKGLIGTGLALMGACVVIFVLIAPLLTKGKILFSLLFSFLLGLTVAITYAPGRTFIQEATPAKIRGRVFGTLTFLIALASIPPSILVTFITEVFTLRWFLAVSGTIILIIGVIIIKKGHDIILAANHRS